MARILRRWLPIVGIVLLLVAFVIVVIAPLVPRYIMSRYVERQITEQSADRRVPLQRPLDFAPFETALDQLSTQRNNELDTLLRLATITDLQRFMDAQQLSAEELVTFYLKRIQRYDLNQLNSVIELNPEALQIARERDQERAQNRMRGPLHGIPILLKDNIATGDQLHTSAGAAALAAARAERDAFVVQRLRAAGAIILGKTNLSEWAGYMADLNLHVNGYSALGGYTRNPHGRFDVGGSSSGSAVAAAANFAAATIGTETAGSITFPASQNSVVGLKPTTGLVSRDLVIPISSALDTPGPITRHVADAALLLSVIAAPDPNDPLTTTTQIDPQQLLAALSSDGLKGARIGMIKLSAREGDNELLNQTSVALSQMGATVVELRLGRARANLDLDSVFQYGLRTGLDAYAQASGTTISLRDVVAFNQQDLTTRAPYGQAQLEAALANTLSEAEYNQLANTNRETAATRLRELMKTKDVNVLMTVGNSLAGLYAPAGWPALTVPAGVRPSGEPIGVTFIADTGQEALLIGVAYVYEQKAQQRREPYLQ